jgi:YD repeat-containing protein
VTKKDLLAAFVIFAIALFCGLHLHAQSCTVAVSCGTYTLWWASCIPVLPAGAYDCAPVGGFTSECVVNTCVPPCPECDAQSSKPVHLATGDTYITQTDVRIPGLGGGLALSRSWHSIPFSSRSTLGMFGPNWTSSFEENVFVDTGNVVTYLRGDGGVWYFAWRSWDSNGNPYFAVGGPASQTATLTQMVLQPTPYWTLVFQSGETRVYDWISGKLLSITDRNGNTTALSYDASYRLSTVTDAVNRHLYFSYASPSSFLVTGVTSDFGVSLQYAYDGQGRLSQVTYPDQTTVSYQYDQGSRITAVMDSNGKVLESHTYNTCGQGLTAARGGGVEAVTVSYPLPCALGVPAAMALISGGSN